MLDRLAGRISGMLDLSDEQEVELEQITERFRQQLSDMGAPPPDVENLRNEMREARRAGDDARARELRAQLDELRGERMAAHAEVAAEYLAEVETILHEEQLERFQQFRERFAQAGPAGDRIRGLQRLIPELQDRLEFSEAQRARYDEVTNCGNRSATGRIIGGEWGNCAPVSKRRSRPVTLRVRRRFAGRWKPRAWRGGRRWKASWTSWTRC
jgi:hypothetical protein